MSDIVLVGTDFSTRSQRAIDRAARIAETLGASLLVTHAWNTAALAIAPFSGSIPIEPLMRTAREAAEAALEVEVERCRAKGLEVRGEVVDGAASRVLVETAERVRARLIVVGRRGAADLSHVLLGSVSERVARTADRPVLVVPGAGGEPIIPRRLLVGVDFSGAAREAVRVATTLAKDLECAEPPLFVHAYQDERAEWLAAWSEIGRPLHRSHEPDALGDWLKRGAPELAGADCLSIGGAVEERLVETARARGCGWIVLGLQGRTALASFLMGTTTRRVLELADRPILIVPARGAPEREPID